MRPHTVAIIQARMASSRLANKVLLDIGGQPMLVWVVERVRRAKSIDQVVVATTIDPSDDTIQALCQTRGYPCYRGSAFDVLDRYYQAAQMYRADIIVRITADCPLMDPDLVDHLVNAFTGSTTIDTDSAVAKPQLANHDSRFPYDFAATRLPPPWGRTYPVGLDIEVCSFDGLQLAWEEAALPHQREHVMPFFYEQPERFRIFLLNHKEDYGYLRWTVDTQPDLELIRAIVNRFAGRDDFSWLEVLALVQDDPSLSQINAQVKPKDYRLTDERNISSR